MHHQCNFTKRLTEEISGTDCLVSVILNLVLFDEHHHEYKTEKSCFKTFKCC